MTCLPLPRPPGEPRPPAPRRLGTALLVVLGLLATPLLVAGAGVLLPGTQPADGSGDPAFPPFRDAALPGTLERPGLCDNCHADYRSAGQTMYEIWDTWSGSMMANAGRDPLFWAALDVANQDDATLGNAGVGDLCLRCHVPTAWYEGRSTCTTPWGEEFDGACLLGQPDMVDNDFEGITCAFCHRMYDASAPPAGEFLDPAAPYAGNAQVYISTVERTMRGPYSDAVPFGHLTTFSPLHLSSAFCGQCHDVTNPVLNRRDVATGADLGYKMPIERTWSEYSQSRYADSAAPEFETCQECHMPAADLDGDGRPDDAYACSQEPGLRGAATALQGPVRKHVFAGANTWMLGVLRDEIGTPLGRYDQFNSVIGSSQDLLTNRTVQATVVAPPVVTAGNPIAVNVRVTNLAGHKFPTGYPEGRRAFIQLTAGEDLDLDGVLAPNEVQFESAAYDAASGVLTLDAQAKVYETKLGVWNFNGTGQCDLVDAGRSRAMFHFALNDCVVSDNRIPPLGFTPNQETAPVAHVYPPNPALPGTLANWDDTPYTVPIPDTTTRQVVVEARIRYQSTSREYLEFLLDENRSTCDPFDAGCDPTQPDPRPNRSEKMWDLWVRYGRAEPVDLVLARTIVAVDPAPPGACCIDGGCQELLPGDCRLLEGSFQGGSTTCLASPCPGPALPPGEASNVLAGALPLLVTGYDRMTGVLDLGYDPACDATDHALVWSPLASVSTRTWSALACGLGTSGTATLAPGPGSTCFLIVGRSTVAEGPYGADSGGLARPQRVGADPCDRPQDLSATCR